MKILITGAGGFMGSHLYDYLKTQGHDVAGLDNFSIGKNLMDQIYKVELLDKTQVEAIVRNVKPDLIYHLAAWAHEGLSQFSPIKITENNYNAYLNLIVPAIKYGVKRIVVTSSMSVYGDQKPPFDEEMNLKPVDIYGQAKAAMENAMHILSKVHGIEYNIVRPHNVYGPRQNMADPYRNVVAIFINAAMRDKPLYVYGDGEQKRSFSYIDDVTPALAEAGLIEKTGQIYNVGPTEEYSINQLAEEIMKHFKTAKKVHMPDRPLEVKDAYCTNTKAMTDLGYTTKTPFADGIAKMVSWALQHGPVVPLYLNHLELESKDTPVTWRDRLI